MRNWRGSVRFLRPSREPKERGPRSRGRITVGVWAAVLVLGSVVMPVGAATRQSASHPGTVLFGVAAGVSYDASGNPVLGATDYLRPMTDWQHRDNSVINIYDGLSSANGATVFSTSLPTIWDDYHSVPMISFNTNNYSNAQVLAGQADPSLAAFASALAGWVRGTDAEGVPAPPGGRRVYLRLDWEANQTWYGWAGPYQATSCAVLAANEARYVRMWRHVHDLIMSTGGFDSRQVSWIYSVYSTSGGPRNCSDGSSDVVARQYPGDNYVDWVGIDGYAFKVSPAPLPKPAAIFGPVLNELTSLTRRPVSIDEVGVSTRDGLTQYGSASEKAAWIRDYFAYLSTVPVRMSVWFGVRHTAYDLPVFSPADEPGSSGDCSYTSGGVPYIAYCEYRRGIAGPGFISTDTQNPRLLTDDQFRGAGRR